MSALNVTNAEAGMILECLKAQASRQESAMGAVSASLATLISKVESQASAEPVVEVVSTPPEVVKAEEEAEALFGKPAASE